jgi:hypothetical protein
VGGWDHRCPYLHHVAIPAARHAALRRVDPAVRIKPIQPIIMSRRVRGFATVPTRSRAIQEGAHRLHFKGGTHRQQYRGGGRSTCEITGNIVKLYRPRRVALA